MRSARKVRRAITAATVLILTTAGLAQAAENVPGPDASASAPGFVIINPRASGTVTTRAGTFYPTGPIDDDTLIVIANSDGTLPGGLTETRLEQLVEARSSGDGNAIQSHEFSVSAEGVTAASKVSALLGRSYIAAPYAWTSAYTGAGIWGWDETATVSYTFSVTEGTNQQAAGQGLGYYRGYNGSELGVWAKWYSLGVLATSGTTGGGTVPWGAVVATAKFKAMSTVPSFAIGYWNP